MKKYFIIAVCLISLVTPLSITHAQTPSTTASTSQPRVTTQPQTQASGVSIKKYIPLIADFNNVIPTGGKEGDFAGFFNYLLKTVIGLAGILAVLMIVIGGIQYVSTDSWSGKDSGKKRIQAALGGLLLALSSYLILNTIDPSLTYLNFASNLQVGQDNPENNGTATGGGEWKVGGSGTTPAGTGPNGTVVPVGSQPVNNELSALPDGSGYQVTPSNIALDNDGRNPPPFPDPDSKKGPGYQPRTSYTVNGQYLDANTDPYVVVPIGSPIPNGTRVTITNHTTGRQVEAVVGDRGPAYGEMSRAAAVAIGSWTDGMGNTISQHNITFTFHTK
jgi:hypothetical protein